MPAIRLSQSPTPACKSGLRIAGFSETFNDKTMADIPKLWARLAPRLPLLGQLGGETFGICASAGAPGLMRYTAGVRFEADASAPDGVDVVDLSPQSYVVFQQILDGGPLHPQMQQAAKEIWSERFPTCGFRRARAPDLEFYPADFQPDTPGCTVEWWIPVET